MQVRKAWRSVHTQIRQAKSTRRRSLVDVIPRVSEMRFVPYEAAYAYLQRRSRPRRLRQKEQRNQRASGEGVTWCSDVLCSIDEWSTSSASRREGA